MSGTRDPLLTIGTDIVEGGVEITVTDNGPGVPEEIQPKLFNERINKPEGSTGLGIALLIVQAVPESTKAKASSAKPDPRAPPCPYGSPSRNRTKAPVDLVGQPLDPLCNKVLSFTPGFSPVENQ